MPSLELLTYHVLRALTSKLSVNCILRDETEDIHGPWTIVFHHFFELVESPLLEITVVEGQTLFLFKLTD